jgi:hypothetical protein
MSNINCLNNVTNILNSLCFNNNICNVTAKNTLFGDNCIGTNKYLHVDYCCNDPITTTTTTTTTTTSTTATMPSNIACEGTSLQIDCPSSHSIQITNAVYGKFFHSYFKSIF